jgi:hypothetical protein
MYAFATFPTGYLYLDLESQRIVLVLWTTKDGDFCKEVLEFACCNGHVCGYTGKRQTMLPDQLHTFKHHIGDGPEIKPLTTLEAAPDGTVYTVALIFKHCGDTTAYEAVVDALRVLPTARLHSTVSCRAVYLGELDPITENQEGMNWVWGPRPKCVLTLNGAPIPITRVLALDSTPNCAIEILTDAVPTTSEQWWNLLGTEEVVGAFLETIDSADKLVMNAELLLRLLLHMGGPEAVGGAARNIVQKKVHLNDERKEPGTHDSTTSYSAPPELLQIMAYATAQPVAGHAPRAQADGAALQAPTSPRLRIIPHQAAAPPPQARPTRCVTDLIHTCLQSALDPAAYNDHEWPTFHEDASVIQFPPFKNVLYDSEMPMITYHPDSVMAIADVALWEKLLEPLLPTTREESRKPLAIAIAALLGQGLRGEEPDPSFLQAMIAALPDAPESGRQDRMEWATDGEDPHEESEREQAEQHSSDTEVTEPEEVEAVYYPSPKKSKATTKGRKLEV